MFIGDLDEMDFTVPIKYVTNDCEGRFELSDEAIKWLKNHGAEQIEKYKTGNIKRNDPLLIQCIEELKEKASVEGISKITVNNEELIVIITNDNGFEDSIFD